MARQAMLAVAVTIEAMSKARTRAPSLGPCGGAFWAESARGEVSMRVLSAEARKCDLGEVRVGPRPLSGRVEGQEVGDVRDNGPTATLDAVGQSEPEDVWKRVDSRWADLAVEEP